MKQKPQRKLGCTQTTYGAAADIPPSMIASDDTPTMTSRYPWQGEVFYLRVSFFLSFFAVLLSFTLRGLEWFMIDIGTR